mmetsp:Transcript_34792/g.62658  ORF Transcript_34792/g.62658 Transcript_34792/m.62658 type:complete len:270 (-) Transcript_34792:174-983(-)
MEPAAALRRLWRVSPLQHDLAVTAFRSFERLLPSTGIQSHGLGPDPHDAAVEVLGRTVHDQNVVTLLHQSELLALSRGLLAVKLTPNSCRQATALFLRHLFDGALPLFRKEGANPTTHHGDGLVLLHVAQLLHQSVRFCLVVGVEPRHEVSAAVTPALPQRPGHAHLHAGAFHYTDVRLAFGVAPQHLEGAVFRRVLDEDDFKGPRSHTHLTLHRAQAIQNKVLGVSHGDEPRYQGLRCHQRSRQDCGGRHVCDAHSVGVVVPIPLSFK